MNAVPNRFDGEKPAPRRPANRGGLGGVDGVCGLLILRPVVHTRERGLMPGRNVRRPREKPPSDHALIARWRAGGDAFASSLARSLDLGTVDPARMARLEARVDAAEWPLLRAEILDAATRPGLAGDAWAELFAIPAIGSTRAIEAVLESGGAERLEAVVGESGYSDPDAPRVVLRPSVSPAVVALDDPQALYGLVRAGERVLRGEAEASATGADRIRAIAGPVELEPDLEAPTFRLVLAVRRLEASHDGDDGLGLGAFFRDFRRAGALGAAGRDALEDMLPDDATLADMAAHLQQVAHHWSRAAADLGGDDTSFLPPVVWRHAGPAVALLIVATQIPLFEHEDEAATLHAAIADDEVSLQLVLDLDGTRHGPALVPLFLTGDDIEGFLADALPDGEAVLHEDPLELPAP